MPSIEDQVDVAAPREAIVAALTSEDGNRGWWSRLAEVGDERAVFRFDGGKTAFRFVWQARGPDEVRLRCDGHENAPDWQGTTVTWRLSDAPGGGTRVALAHDGWRDEGRVYTMCIGGWRHFVGSLKKYVETGAGDPF